MNSINQFRDVSKISLRSRRLTVTRACIPPSSDLAVSWSNSRFARKKCITSVKTVLRRIGFTATEIPLTSCSAIRWIGLTASWKFKSRAGLLWNLWKISKSIFSPIEFTSSLREAELSSCLKGQQQLISLIKFILTSAIAQSAVKLMAKRRPLLVNSRTAK